MSHGRALTRDRHLEIATAAVCAVSDAVLVAGGTPADVVEVVTHIAASTVYGAHDRGAEIEAARRFGDCVSIYVGLCVARDQQIRDWIDQAGRPH